MKQFKPNLLTLALMSSGITFGGQVVAQDEVAADDDVEVIEVSGFRRSLIESINQKRYSDTVVESISADDLGALPDVSIGEALARLPGVTAVRTGGQAGALNIRGMSGDMVYTTLNGREQVSTSGSRSVEFEQYPSELITSAAVYKSPKASLIEGGVAGTVEMTTVSPLSISDESRLNVNVRGSYNDRAGEVSDANEFGHRLSVSYQRKFMDDTLGVALGFSRLFQPDVQTQFIGLQYYATDTDLTNDGQPNEHAISEGMELQHKGGEETRDGFLATVEWAPSDTFKLKADAFHSTFESKAFARGFRIKDFTGNEGGIRISAGDLENPIFINDSLIGGTIKATDTNRWNVQTVNDNNTEDESLTSIGINAEWILDDLTITADFAHSSATSDFVNGVNWTLMAKDANAASPELVDDHTITYRLNALNLPTISLNKDYTNISGANALMMSKYGTYPYDYEDESTAFKLDAKYQLDGEFISSVEAGVRMSERHYRADRSVFEYGSDWGFRDDEKPLKLTDDMVKVVDWEGDFSHFPSYIAIDLDKALPAWFDAQNIDATPKKRWANDWTMIQSGDVYEDVLAAYAQANLDFDVGIPVTGNIGVRVVQTDQYSDGLQNVQGDTAAGATCIKDETGAENCSFAHKRVGKDFTDVLPSINLNFQISEQEQLRVAAAKVMARAPIDQLKAGIGSWYDGAPNADGKAVFNAWGDTSPLLDPFYATQLDISYERYFEETEGAFVAAVFYKNIESFVEKQSLSNYDFEGNGWDIPDSYTLDGETTPREVAGGTFNTAVNNDNGGYIRGLELAYTQTFSFLPEPFSGLGVNMSYAYTESEIEQEGISGSGKESAKANLEGLSPHVFSGTLYYNNGGFDTRVNLRYVDDFVGDQVAEDAQLVFYASETVIDYQASYQFNDNLKGLFQITNITDEPTRTYFGSKNLTGTIQHFGRTVFMGINYSM
ncbi:TonB-dependent receptor [Saccharobesus litoralis]|uniref:TonB-dependent receptor n=1 Tax=Saccharobesus litoralis TaxID=2172099 RepID=A0A2S0VTD4_9ALTE|nr:TonB-dependent receptor [Saccharobesus litoralis]AWB67469.1 TonB-dependent receptor [Saccharobesus litoralis]